METSSMVRVVSSSTVKPPPRPSHRIPLTSWDVAMLSTDYIQKGLLFHKPSSPPALHVVDHLAATLGDALADYYPVAGRFITDRHRDELGNVVGCSVSIHCDGQGVEIFHAVADGVSIADVITRDADVPRVVHSFFPLNDAVGIDGHEFPLFTVQVTELADGVFVGFACNHALADGTAWWDFLNAWAEIARARLNFANREPEGEAPLHRAGRPCWSVGQTMEARHRRSWSHVPICLNSSSGLSRRRFARACSTSRRSRWRRSRSWPAQSCWPPATRRAPPL
jgi:hypothetical protein